MGYHSHGTSIVSIVELEKNRVLIFSCCEFSHHPCLKKFRNARAMNLRRSDWEALVKCHPAHEVMPILRYAHARWVPAK